MGIGEHVWLGEIDENSFHNIDDPNCERRKKVAPPFTPHKPPHPLPCVPGEQWGRGEVSWWDRAVWGTPERHFATASSAGSGE